MTGRDWAYVIWRAVLLIAAFGFAAMASRAIARRKYDDLPFSLTAIAITLINFADAAGWSE